MDQNDFLRAIFLTNVVKSPAIKIFTFWETKFRWFIATEREESCLLRQGELTCSKPDIITPETMKDIFQGFNADAIQFAEDRYQRHLSRLRMLGYQFRNRLEKEELIGTDPEQVTDNLLKTRKEDDTAIIRAPEDLWPVSLIKVAFETVSRSASGNFRDLEERGYFLSDEDKNRKEIEILFEEAARNPGYVRVLGGKLQEYGLFSEYEDRFYRILN